MNSFTGIVLKNGERFSGRANVTDYEVTITWKKCRRPRAQECFYNAQKFCMDHGYPFWEGYFLIGGQPMHHAWNVMDDGEVVDFTRKAVLRKAKRENNLVDDRPPLYFGVNVPRSFILEHILEGGSGESIGEEFWPRVKPKKTR